MGESKERASWNKVGYHSRESMEGFRRKPRRDTVHREVWGVQGRSKRKDTNNVKASAKNEGKRGGTLIGIRGVKGRDRN